MNVFVNCCPSGYNGDSELVTVQVPKKYTDEVLAYARMLSDSYGIEDTRVVKDIVKESIMQIQQRYYDRQNRKTQKS
jgi:hypothetical protein